MPRLPILALILSLSAMAAGAHETERPYRLPGDPDSMVRRGPEVTPAAPAAGEADAGNRAVRVEDLPPSATRPPPDTRLTVSREVYLPAPGRYVYYPDPRWRLRILREDGDWSGEFVYGTPGWGWWPLPAPSPEPPRTGRARVPNGG